MKKLITILSSILLTVVGVSTAFAAAVPPQTLSGNASSTYVPPTGYIYYELPGSGAEGTHTVTFNSSGAVDPAGGYIFTATVGTVATESNTRVLSWISNFPIYAVIVQGADAFNVYQYNNAAVLDTNLVAPPDETGQLSDVFYVAVVFNPAQLPAAVPQQSTGLLLLRIITLAVLFLFLSAITALLAVITRILLRISILCIGKAGGKIDIDIGNNSDINIGNKIEKKTDIDIEKNTNIDIEKNINIENNIDINVKKHKDKCEDGIKDVCEDSRKDTSIDKVINDYYDSNKNWKNHGPC